MIFINGNFDLAALTFPGSLRSKRKKLDKKLRKMSKNLKKEIGCDIQLLKNNGKKYYENNYRFYSKTDDGKEFSFLISTTPILMPRQHQRCGSNYMKLEFNPNKVGYDGAKKIREVMEKLIGEKKTKEIASTCNVTRIDMCVDARKDVSNLFPYYPRCKNMNIYMDDVSKEITGFTLGSGKSQIRITVYNKKKELEKKGNFIIDGFLYRLEIRVRNLGCNLLDLDILKIKNQFSKIIFFNSGIFNEEKFSSSFKSDAQEYGVNKAILNLNRKDRQKYLRILKKKYVENNVFDINGINVDTFLDPIEPLLY